MLRMDDVSERVIIILTVPVTHLYDDLGNTESTPEKAEAIAIIKRCKKNNNEYKSLSEDNQDILLAILQEYRNTCDTGIVGKPEVQLQDIRTTLDSVGREVCICTVHPAVLTDSYIEVIKSSSTQQVRVYRPWGMK
jgi:hypothetical protein